MKRLLAEARRRQFLDLLLQQGGMRTRELARLMGVSEATIRRDLALLAKQGLVDRAHGGALPLREEPPYAQKLGQATSVKEAIAQAASELVEEGMTLVLDSGTTALALARRLAGRRLRVLALDLPVAQALAQGETEVWCPGGRVRNGFYSLVGSWTEEPLAAFRPDLFFMGADALDREGVTNFTLEEALVKRQAMGVSGATVLLADRSKWGRRAPAFVAPWKAIRLLISDLEPEALRDLVEVRRVALE